MEFSLIEFSILDQISSFLIRSDENDENDIYYRTNYDTVDNRIVQYFRSHDRLKEQPELLTVDHVLSREVIDEAMKMKVDEVGHD